MCRTPRAGTPHGPRGVGRGLDAPGAAVPPLGQGACRGRAADGGAGRPRGAGHTGQEAAVRRGWGWPGCARCGRSTARPGSPWCAICWWWSRPRCRPSARGRPRRAEMLDAAPGGLGVAWTRHVVPSHRSPDARGLVGAGVSDRGAGRGRGARHTDQQARPAGWGWPGGARPCRSSVRPGSGRRPSCRCKPRRRCRPTVRCTPRCSEKRTGPRPGRGWAGSTTSCRSTARPGSRRSRFRPRCRPTPTCTPRWSGNRRPAGGWAWPGCPPGAVPPLSERPCARASDRGARRRRRARHAAQPAAALRGVGGGLDGPPGAVPPLRQRPGVRSSRPRCTSMPTCRTRRSGNRRPRGLGVGWMGHRVPFHRSARVRDAPVVVVLDPTAVHADGDVHATPNRLLTAARIGLGVGKMRHEVPFHCSARLTPIAGGLDVSADRHARVRGGARHPEKLACRHPGVRARRDRPSPRDHSQAPRQRQSGWSQPPSPGRLPRGLPPRAPQRPGHDAAACPTAGGGVSRRV